MLRDFAGLPRAGCRRGGVILQVAFLGSLVLPASAPLALKTRTGALVLGPRESPVSPGVTAAFTRLSLLLLPLDGSVESGDVFAAAAESSVVSVARRRPEASSSPNSMSP